MRKRFYFTPQQIAEMVNVTIDKPYDWIRDGSLPAVNVARHAGGKARWRVSAEDLEAFLQRRRTQPPAPAPRRKKRQGQVIEFY